MRTNCILVGVVYRYIVMLFTLRVYKGGTYWGTAPDKTCHAWLGYRYTSVGAGGAFQVGYNEQFDLWFVEAIKGCTYKNR